MDILSSLRRYHMLIIVKANKNTVKECEEPWDPIDSIEGKVPRLLLSPQQIFQLSTF